MSQLLQNTRKIFLHSFGVKNVLILGQKRSRFKRPVWRTFQIVLVCCVPETSNKRYKPFSLAVIGDIFTVLVLGAEHFKLFVRIRI